jgi:hypothetical protein
MARAAIAVDDRLTAGNSFRSRLDLEVRNRRTAACCFTMPAIVRALTDDTTIANTAARLTPPHFKNLFPTRQARKADQASNAAIAMIAVKPRMFCTLGDPWVNCDSQLPTRSVTRGNVPRKKPELW